MRKNRLWIITVILCVLLSACSGKSGSHESKAPQNSGGSGGSGSSAGGSGSEGGSKQSGQGEEEEGEPHEYIQDAKTVKIEQIDANKLDISGVVFLDEKTLALSCPKDIGEKKSFIYNMETKQTSKLPDNTTVLRKLDSGDLFVGAGKEGAYAILDGTSFVVKKAIKRPDTVDLTLDISPDTAFLAYITNDGLFIANTDFQNPVKIVGAKREADEFKTEKPRYPHWIDNGRISYRMLAWESVKYCAVVMRDGTNNTVYESAKNSSIYPLVSGDYISLGEYGTGVGVIDGITRQKREITKEKLEYEGFAYDKNGKWVSFFRTNSDTAGDEKWTAKLEIRSIASGEKIKEYTSEKPNAKPIENATASPDGKYLLFTDLDKSGRRMLYKMEINMQEQSGSSSQSGGGKSS